jgi:hypothetical protein
MAANENTTPTHAHAATALLAGIHALLSKVIDRPSTDDTDGAIWSALQLVEQAQEHVEQIGVA